MQRDKKVGLALGILLVGIVAACFFRNEAVESVPLPELADADRLDREIAASAEPTPYPSLYKIEPLESGTAAALGDSNLSRADEPPFFTKPDFLDDDLFSYEGLVVDGTGGDPRGILIHAPSDAPETAGRSADRNRQAPSGTPSAAADDNAHDGPFHVIRRGETLSALAGRYLGSTTRYLEIYAANRHVLKSPHDLPVGARIRIPSRPPVQHTPVRHTQVRPPDAPAIEGPSRPAAPPAVNGNEIKPPSKAEETPASSSKFTPVRSSPFVPRHYNTRTGRADSKNDPPKVLTQTPPGS